MAQSSFGFSSLVSLLACLVAIGVGLGLKEVLGSSRQGTLIAGGLAALVFTFTLTAISNWKMMNFGTAAKCGLTEVVISLLIAVLYAASIHRVAITITLLFSGVMLFFLNGISQSRYHSGQSGAAVPTPGGHEGKKRK